MWVEVGGDVEVRAGTYSRKQVPRELFALILTKARLDSISNALNLLVDAILPLVNDVKAVELRRLPRSGYLELDDCGLIGLRSPSGKYATNSSGRTILSPRGFNHLHESCVILVPADA